MYGKTRRWNWQSGFRPSHGLFRCNNRVDFAALFSSIDDDLVKSPGIDQLLFGTDAHFDNRYGRRHIRQAVEAVEGMNLRDGDKKKIYQDNAIKLLRLPLGFPRRSRRKRHGLYELVAAGTATRERKNKRPRPPVPGLHESAGRVTECRGITPWQ